MDGTRQNIENCLNDFMVALVRTSVCKRNDRPERERRKRERIDQQIRWYEEEKQRKEETAKLQELVQEATNWRTGHLIRSYVEAIKAAESTTRAGETNASLLQWMTWALEQADKIDPLNARLSLH